MLYYSDWPQRQFTKALSPVDSWPSMLLIPSLQGHLDHIKTLLGNDLYILSGFSKYVKLCIENAPQTLNLEVWVDALSNYGVLTKSLRHDF